MTMQRAMLTPVLALALAAVAFPGAAADTAAGPRDAGTVTTLPQRVLRVRKQMADRVTQADRDAAAKRLAELKAKLEAARAATGVQPTTTSSPKSAPTSLRAGATTTNLEIPPGVTPPGPGGVPDYFTTANWAFSPPLRKFVDTLPGLGAPNNLGQQLTVAVPDTVTYPGSDYYEIELREYQERMHSDLNPTTLRGYVQVNHGTNPGVANPTLADNTVAPAPIHYLGPVIVATRNRPVRLKFTNKLPTGEAGKLNVPVDTTIMGSGPGPLYPDGSDCDSTNEAAGCAMYAQNRATIHLHGGRTPWISDGTPHQWVVPEGEVTPYQKGVSYENVPDMPDPGPGAMTFYYSNQQSARLLFYHDHAWGITRLNVLVGEAAGYLITDEYEKALVDTFKLPAEQIPLILQDRTFVEAEKVRDTDPTWNWGSGPLVDGIRTPVTGDFWIPHVYMPAQNPYDISGVNPFGRWVYGPWFFPPTKEITHGPVENPYYDVNCESPDPVVFATCTTPGQPPEIPGTPNVSVGMETFFDTMLVNGTAFPTKTVEPKPYRFRILNAANDRFMNLGLYVADPSQVATDGRTLTEVKTVPAAAGNWDPIAFPLWPTDGRDGDVPDPATVGPDFIQIGTEGGFLPRPVVVRSQPITYVTDPTAFNFGNVKDHGLLLGPAERADVIIDFSAFAGQTLILYNDAPAAFPARDPRADYFTGAGDLSDSGGHTGPQVGFGPNTRTILQIRVSAEGTPSSFDLAALEEAFAPVPGVRPGVFESGQEPIIVGQAAYNGVYSSVTFPSNWPYWGISRIQDESLRFKTVGGNLVEVPMEPKGLHDEMGAAFDKEYGRMSGNLGTTNPNASAVNTNFTLYNFTDPPTEVTYEAITPPLGDGTQLWKISHNGVDTHPLHFHIFDVQLVNRVGWDGQIRPPDPTELGWKDTIRTSPLEDTIVALRPTPPKLPFNIPDSLRPLNPAIPLHSGMGFTNIDPITQEPKVPPDTNEIVSFAWEYVWHCHILSHEEMDMMRPIVLNVVSLTPAAPMTLRSQVNGAGVTLDWTDGTPVNYVTHAGFGNRAAEIGFRVQRAPEVGGTFATIATALANQTHFVDGTASPSVQYQYRVVAYNEAGTSASNVVTVNAPPVAGVAPASLAFGNQQLGTTSAAKTVTISNTGLGELALGTIAFAGTNPGDFAQTNACGGLVPAGGSCTVSVAFKPTAPAARAATLSVTTNDPAQAVLSVELAGVGISLTVAANYPSPQVAGSAVVFTATAQGGSNYQYRFRFWNGSVWTTLQDYGPSSTWSLPTNIGPGAYYISAEVRTSTLVTRDAIVWMPYTLTANVRATGVTLTGSAASPHYNGTEVVFTAAGAGASNYQYRFRLWNGTVWTTVQEYSASTTWTMPAGFAAGVYNVSAEVRTSPLVTRDAIAYLPYTVTDIQPATGLTLTATPRSPQLAGTPVIFSATASGGTGTYQYRFRFWNGSVWTTVQDYGTASTWSMPTTTPAGSYYVSAEVKTSTLVTRDLIVYSPFVVK